MLGAIIFDFDGVIADTEPLHYRAFAEVFSASGIFFTAQEYFTRYLGLNDATFLKQFVADRGSAAGEVDIARFRREKNAAYECLIASGLELLPGVKVFIEEAGRRWPLAICSGARRGEIISLLRQHGLEGHFRHIVATEDVPISKPDPAGYLRTLELLRQEQPRLNADACLVIEDSLLGIRAARAADMRVLAVLGSGNHPSNVTTDARRAEANWACESLLEVDVDRVGAWFATET